MLFIDSWIRGYESRVWSLESGVRLIRTPAPDVRPETKNWGLDTRDCWNESSSENRDGDCGCAGADGAAVAAARVIGAGSEPGPWGQAGSAGPRSSDGP